MSAQGDFGNNPVDIGPSRGNINVTPSGNTINSPSIFDTPPASGSIGVKEPNSGFGKTTDFANPNERYIDKLNKKEGDTDTTIRKNMYLGDFKTKSVFVKVRYRDHEYPDGDLIRVYVNDLVLEQAILMEHDFKGFDLTLSPGFNKIDFEALNQGTSGPNTAEFEIYDDKGKMISTNRWHLATGFKATVIVVQE